MENKIEYESAKVAQIVLNLYMEQIIYKQATDYTHKIPCKHRLKICKL